VSRALFDTSPQERSDPFQWMHQVWRLVTAECWLRAQGDPGGPRLPAGMKPSAARVAVRPVAGSYVFPP